MRYYDENSNLVSVSNSLLKHFNCETFHPSLKELDEVLKNTSKKHICLVLFDGLGSKIQDVHKDDCPFIRNHKLCEITSVFPPTTAAATTALLSGRYPIETGWLGWNQKFKEWDTIVTMFSSTFVDENNDVTPISTYSLCSHEDIISMMKKNDGSKNFEAIYQFDLEDPTVGGFFNKLDEVCAKNDFTYAYCKEPDHLLHRFGSGSKEVSDMIRILDKGLEIIARNHKDTLFIVLADHGHIVCKEYSIYEHQDFFSLLSSPQFSIEGRAAAFYVKEDKREEFNKLAHKYYEKDFDIYTKEQVKKEHIFGLGEEQVRFDYAIGDFLFIAHSDAVFTQEYGEQLLSHHAGGTDLEKYINLSIIDE